MSVNKKEQWSDNERDTSGGDTEREREREGSGGTMIERGSGMTMRGKAEE